MIYYVFLLIMTIIGSVASLFLKKASQNKNMKETFFSTNLHIGGCLYLLTSLINIYILRYLDYSVVLPLTSITYIWTLIISHFILYETISLKKIYGIILIIVGAVFVTL